MSLIQEALKRQQAEAAARPGGGLERRPAVVRYAPEETPDRHPARRPRRWVSALLLMLLLLAVSGLAALILLGPEAHRTLRQMVGAEPEGGEPVPGSVGSERPGSALANPDSGMGLVEPTPTPGIPGALPPDPVSDPLDTVEPPLPPPPPPPPTPMPFREPVVWPALSLDGVVLQADRSRSLAFLNRVLVSTGGIYKGVRLVEVREDGVRVEFQGEERWLTEGDPIRGPPP